MVSYFVGTPTWTPLQTLFSLGTGPWPCVSGRCCACCSWRTAHRTSHLKNLKLLNFATTLILGSKAVLFGRVRGQVVHLSS